MRRNSLSLVVAAAIAMASAAHAAPANAAGGAVSNQFWWPGEIPHRKLPLLWNICKRRSILSPPTPLGAGLFQCT